MYRILFVCMANICRSPTAEGVVRHFVERSGLAGRVAVDSAGTHGYHVGEAPDPRAQRAAARRGYRLSSLRARRVSERDFGEFDLILAMDRNNLESLQRLCPPGYLGQLGLLMDYAANFVEEEVPDPYYGQNLGFDRVLDMVEDAASGLIEMLRRQEGAP